MKNTKNIIIIIFILLLVICFWIITLKLNLQKDFQFTPRSGLSFEQLRNEINEIINKSPLIKSEQDDQKKIDELTEKLAEELKNTETADWQTYTNEEYGYEYKCPTDWELHLGKNYGGDVDVSQCNKIYFGTFSFDDGVGVSFAFVPSNIAENYQVVGKKWSETLMDNVKNQPNAIEYSNNSFNGWISFKYSGHTLILLARRQVDEGYYEVSVNAVGDTKTDSEYKTIVDQIISTFKFLE